LGSRVCKQGQTIDTRILKAQVAVELGRPLQ
jgi:hypothetical protein